MSGDLDAGSNESGSSNHLSSSRNGSGERTPRICASDRRESGHCDEVLHDGFNNSASSKGVFSQLQRSQSCKPESDCLVNSPERKKEEEEWREKRGTLSLSTFRPEGHRSSSSTSDRSAIRQSILAMVAP